MGLALKKIRAGDSRNYLWLVLIIVLVYTVAILNFVLIEGKSVSNAVLESACTSLYVDCSATTSFSTKVVHVLLGLSTMAALVVIVSAGVDFFLNDLIGGRKMKKTINSLRNHFIVCGYGVLGQTVCGELTRLGKPFLVIEMRPHVIEHLRSERIPAIQGDALVSSVLLKAGVDKAQAVIAALPDDAKNVFLTLTAKDLKPGIKVATRAFNESSISKLHSAGAEIVVMPDVVAGLVLSNEVLGIKESRVHKILSRKNNKA
ncbi:MAG: NAD(P)-binding protein [Candidatus Micrarchaeota archaeon]